MHEVAQGQGMRNAEMLVWAGDFNYRIDATYEDAIDRIRCNDLEYLLERVCNLLTSSFSYACADPAHHTSCSSDGAAVHVDPFVSHSHAELSNSLVLHAALSAPCPVTLPPCSKEQVIV